MADLSALGLERVEMQFELNSSAITRSIGYGQDYGNGSKAGTRLICCGITPNASIRNILGRSAFSFPLDTREGCWEIQEGEYEHDCCW